MIVGESEGPRFGMSDLMVVEPFNAHSSCSSMANVGSYKIPVNEQGHSLLTDQWCEFGQCCYFTITEIEVWHIINKSET